MKFGQNLKASPQTVNGFERIDTVTHTWADIRVHYDEKYPGPGETWTDMRSTETMAIIRLEQRGGICEPRFDLNQPVARSRHDVGFFNWIPPDQKLWCYSDNARFLRDLRLTLDTARVPSIIGADYDCSKLYEPRLIVYNSRVRQCAHLLAEVWLLLVRGERRSDSPITTESHWNGAK